MRNRRPTPEHEEAVARRLALLSAELAAVRAAPSQPSQIPSQTRPAPAPAAWPWDEHTRVRPDDPGARSPASTATPTDPTDPTAPLVTVPVPGRHAARRTTTEAVALVPPGLRGRFALQPLHVSVVAVVIAVALALASWRLARSEPEPLEVRTVGSGTVGSGAVGPLGTTATASASGGPRDVDEGASSGPLPAVPVTGGHDDGASQPGETGAQVTVDVAGKIRRPGIVVLPTGSRVVDAIEAAGGARRGVDLTPLNLARLLVDGEQVLVGVGTVPGTAAGVPPAPGAPAGLVNINTADQTALETLPGVGPVTAGAILGWRTDHGGFTSVDELLEVDGIGEATLERLAPLVTI